MIKKIIKISLFSFLFLSLFIFFINLYVVLSTKKQILNVNDVKKGNYDCILVLGAGVWGDSPSPMLKDRLDVAILLYKKNIAKKIIMSGDHSKVDYDEVNIMKKYAIDNGVLSEDIFMDHAGISTYDSIYRAKNIFKVKKMVIVTQKYHLYRSIYIANKLNIKAIGINSDPRKYSGFIYREAREVIARFKDFIKSIIKPTSKHLGDEISILGDGDITNDK